MPSFRTALWLPVCAHVLGVFEAKPESFRKVMVTKYDFRFMLLVFAINDCIQSEQQHLNAITNSGVAPESGRSA